MNITTQEILDYVKEQPDTRTWNVLDALHWILASLLVEKHGYHRDDIYVEKRFYSICNISESTYPIPEEYAELIVDAFDAIVDARVYDDDSGVWSKAVAVEKIQGAIIGENNANA